MLKTLSQFTLFFMFINFTYARDIFEPFIIKSDNKDICELALNHYKDLYKSMSYGTKGLNNSPNIVTPKFTSSEVADSYDFIKTAEIDFYGSNKLLVFYQQLHNRYGYIFSIYLINPDQIELLENQLTSNNKDELSLFYPIDTSVYGAHFSWHETLPFLYRNKWYVLPDNGDFTRYNSHRNVYQILKDGNSRNVCTIKIFQDFDGIRLEDRFPFFTAYKKSVEEIMLTKANSVCYTAIYNPSNPAATAYQNGQYFSSLAIARPWAAVSAWESTDNVYIKEIIELQKKQFEDWQFQDIWSYREYATYKNLMFDAIIELKNHYIANHSYSEANALQHASKLLEDMPGSYYSLSLYYAKDKDFSIFKRMIEGNYQNWTRLKKDLKYEYGSIPLVALSLMIDNPQQYKNLPSKINQAAIKSFYNKDLLMFAAHMNNFDSVKYLIDNGWRVDKLTTSDEPKMSCDPGLKRFNRSALTYAAENASIEIIKLLVKSGSDTKIKDSQNNSLDYYIKLNPRFSEEEKELGFDNILKKYSNIKLAKPSFSCKGNINRIETEICNSKGLSIYDRELNQNYRKALLNSKIATDLKSSQIKWIKRRNTECGKFSENDKLTACLARTTRSRIRYLEYVQLPFK